MVDSFTTATCHPGDPKLSAQLKGQLVTEPFSCSVQADKERCLNGGGSCDMERDGYYIVNILCVVIGVITFVMYIRPKVHQLQSLPLRAWRLSAAK